MTKFGLVGALGLLADVGVFNLLRFSGGEGILYDRPLTAKVISTALGIVVAWLGHRYWTFREKRRAVIRHEFAMFLGVCLIGLAISLGCLGLSHHVLGLQSPLADNISANVIGLGLASAFRYWAMHTRVFTGTQSKADDALALLRN
ncbi:MAG TPA: GtrA family protein [Micromonosporaceae bacterium]|nr:GtrA family protein [Micromonosporaceae bacterium]